MHLFAGAGGGLLADIILGHKPIIAVEWDAWRCDRLRELQPNIEIECADARSVDYSRWFGRVDCLKAGIPCPRWSKARRGVGNTPDHTATIIRAVAQIRPEWVFLECVPGYLAEHAETRDSLNRIGYTLARPIILDAACLGAPHSRQRYWALGHRNEESESALPLYDKMALLPPISKNPWESDPRDIRVSDGLADARAWVEALGDGQVPIQAAAAWCLLGGPNNFHNQPRGE